MKYNFDFDSNDKGQSKKTHNNHSFPHHLLPKEAVRTSFGSTGSTPKIRLVKVFECFYAGQKLARCLSEYIYCSDAFRDSQLILDNLLHPLCNIMQNCVVSSKSSVAEDAINNALNGEHTDTNSVGLPTQLCIFNIFGPSVLVCFSAIFTSINNQNPTGGGKRKVLNSRQRGTMIEAKNIVMMLIQHFDQSGITGENFEGQLLLSPFFHLMATLLVCLGSYSKTQVLLENTLYTKEVTGTRIWSVYSEALWSNIIQLQICFPDQLELKLFSSLDNTPPFSRLRDLSALPLLYGLNVAKVYLQGDSTLVQYALFYRGDYDGQSPNYGREAKKRILQLQGFREACYSLVGNTVGSSKESGTYLNIKIVYENGLRVHNETFPYSLLLEGSSIERLSLVRTCLKDLPQSFGKCLPNLKFLNLSQNQLSSLPSSFKELKELTRLDIKRNRFKIIPPVIRALTKLCVFIAFDNMIDDISPLIDCRDLETIDVRRNNVKSVPVEFPLKLSNLSKLLLEDDKISIQEKGGRVRNSSPTRTIQHSSNSYSKEEAQHSRLDEGKKQKQVFPTRQVHRGNSTPENEMKKVQQNSKQLAGLSIQRNAAVPTPFSNNASTSFTNDNIVPNQSPFSYVSTNNNKKDPLSLNSKSFLQVNNETARFKAKFLYPTNKSECANDKPKCETHSVKSDEQPGNNKEEKKTTAAPLSLPMGMVHYNQQIDVFRKRKKESKNATGFEY